MLDVNVNIDCLNFPYILPAFLFSNIFPVAVIADGTTVKNNKRNIKKKSRAKKLGIRNGKEPKINKKKL